MKIKNIMWLTLIGILMFFGCQNEEISSLNKTGSLEEREAIDNNVVTIDHTYNYQGSQFKVSYTYDQENNKVLGADGDVKLAQEVFGDEENAPKSLFFNNPIEGSTNIDVMVFDNAEELKAYTAKVANDFPDAQRKAGNVSSKCDSYDVSGNGSFYFYKHANYNTGMLGMWRVGRYYYRHHWVGSGNNDQLSSLVVAKPENKQAIVYLYQHSCYGGKVIGFYGGTGNNGFAVSNLSWYTMSGWWWWKTSWNDQVSSTSGWAW
ncbi:hypothetical protein ACQY1Q_15815 [Tenacibaculum sp. TC6]|uniref:hypothetical protein n=1 Tax=Tenacibaculum sp. TC6 TaxID=3423223 RepID=UPI003D361E0E